MEQRCRDALMLLKEYCQTFGLKPTAKADDFEAWEDDCGPIVAGAFNDNGCMEHMPPVIYVTPSGDIVIEQDEDLITDPSEPVTCAIDHSVVRVSINNKKPIHDVSTTWGTR